MMGDCKKSGEDRPIRFYIDCLTRQQELLKSQLKENEWAPTFEKITPRKPERVGSKMLPLLLDWRWVYRRTENIKINDTGRTTRSITFDYSLPRERQLLWSELKGKDGDAQIVVPVSFLKKGSIINQDIQTNDGLSVPVLRFWENGELTRWAVHALAEYLPNEIFGDNESKTFLGILDRASADVIYSKVNATDFDNESIGAEASSFVGLNEQRHRIFSEIAEAICESGSNRQNKLAQAAEILIAAISRRTAASLAQDAQGENAENALVEGLSTPKEQKKALSSNIDDDTGYGGWDLEEESIPTLWVLSFFVTTALKLTDSLDVHTATADAQTSINKTTVDEVLEMLCSIFALLSTSYLSAVLIAGEWESGSAVIASNDNCRQGESDDSNESFFYLNDRQIIKLRTGTELAPARFGSGLIKRFPKLREYGEVRVPIKYATWSARSTHLEIEPPPGAVISKVEHSVPSINGSFNRIYLRSAHTSVHVHTPAGGSYSQPLTSLNVYMLPARAGRAFLAALCALVFCVVCTFLAFDHYKEPKGFLGAEFPLSVAALSVAIQLALIYSSSLNRLSVEIDQPIKKLHYISVFSAAAAPVLLFEVIRITHVGLRGSSGEVRWVFFLCSWDAFVLGLLIILCFVATCVLLCAAGILVNLRRVKGGVSGERLIPQVEGARGQNIVSNAVSVTETGAFAVNYMGGVAGVRDASRTGQRERSPMHDYFDVLNNINKDGK